MAKRIITINLIVGDLGRSTAFYSKVFGMPPGHEDEDVAMFRFADTYVFLQRGRSHEDATDEVRVLAATRTALATMIRISSVSATCGTAPATRSAPTYRARRSPGPACASVA